ncbi:TlpA family protein disulfide reductase [Plantactinospora sp. GCM10030261]|uniref:TlpA family protein disulfide reductase n=1 Tax=Plantactinospora sp. GCM10030261 TaxID=3273420 RepID=UPI003606AFA5
MRHRPVSPLRRTANRLSRTANRLSPIANRRRGSVSALLVLTLAGTLTAGCGGNGPAESTGDEPGTSIGRSAVPASSPPAAASPSSTIPVPETLRFTAVTVDGKPFDAATLAGKPAVLWFWAAWCTRCRAAAGTVAEVAAANADRVNLVGVSGLNSGDEGMRRFVRDSGIDGFPSLADDDGAVWRRFGVTSQEYYVLLDSAGKVSHSGPLSGAELRQRVADLS